MGPSLSSHPASGPGSTSRRVVMAAFDGAETLDVVGPLEVFSVASRIHGYLAGRATVDGEDGGTTPPAYRVEVVASKPGPLRMESGLAVLATRALGEVEEDLDTLIVPGGAGVVEAMRDEAFLDWLRRRAATATRIASVCTGARVLGAAGLLRGRRATTHWRWCRMLERDNPDTRVEPDAIHVKDGRVWTSAGITAGMDLALAMVEEDHGRALALETARMLVLFLKRPGGQSQFSAQLAAQLAERQPLLDLQAWILEHPHADLRVESLARRVAMSPRNFARAFAAEVGETPARFVEGARVQAARRRLEDSDDGVEAIAASCGFGTAETMRRAFLRAIATSPGAYRARFRPACTSRAASTEETDHGHLHPAL